MGTSQRTRWNDHDWTWGWNVTFTSQAVPVEYFNAAEQCSVSTVQWAYLRGWKQGGAADAKIVQICTLTITLSLVHTNCCFLKIMDSQIKDSRKRIARQCCVNNLQCTSLDEQWWWSRWSILLNLTNFPIKPDLIETRAAVELLVVTLNKGWIKY